MENQDIFFKIRSREDSDATGKSIVLLEPSQKNDLSNYQFDISLLSKDLEVYEYDQDLHFVYESDIRAYFSNTSSENSEDIPLRLNLLQEFIVDIESLN